MSAVYQLGINGLFHDASVCLRVDGRPLLVVEEERLDRAKHSARFPDRGLALCLSTAGITLRDVSDVAVSFQPRRFLLNQIRWGLTNLPESLNLFARGASDVDVGSKLGVLFRMRHHLIRRCNTPAASFRMHFIGHHTAHAYDAYSFSPFAEAAVLIIGGFAEFGSPALFVVNARGIRHVSSIPYPHSLGILYATITEFLGFHAMNDEYKVMGLSAYGEDEYHAALERLLQTNNDGRYQLDLSYFKFHTHGRNRWYADRLEELLGPPRRADEPITQRHKNIACSLQRAVERCGVALAREAHRLTKQKNLCIAGGVGQNVCLNSRLVEETPFEHVFVPPAPS